MRGGKHTKFVFAQAARGDIRLYFLYRNIIELIQQVLFHLALKDRLSFRDRNIIELIQQVLFHLSLKDRVYLRYRNIIELIQQVLFDLALKDLVAEMIIHVLAHLMLASTVTSRR